jgi:tRNA G37 N-methylase Trm5
VAVDIKALIAELTSFYDFRDKTVVSVGAGGGQMVEFARAAKMVIAVDRDPVALEKLRESLAAARLEDIVSPVLSDFEGITARADVVLFEFSLHEMDDPESALKHAATLAPDVVIFDHWPGSEWSYYAGEEAKVAAAWTAISRFVPQKKERRETTQVFEKYEDLFQKLKVMGETSLSRIKKYEGRRDIRIPMLYGLALIGK